MFGRDKKLKPAVTSEPISADHQRLMALINSLTDGVLTVGEQGKIVIANGAAMSLLDANSLTGRDLREVFALLDTQGRAVEVGPLLNLPTSYSSSDLHLKRADGSLINLEINISPVKLGYGTAAGGGFVILLRDISPRKQEQNENDEFINVASQELRSPVAIAGGSISSALLLAQKSQVGPALIQSLESAHSQITLLTELLNDLSMLAKSERRDQPLNSKTIDVNTFLREMADAFRPQAEQKGLEFVYKAPPPNLSLISSEPFVREILQNFITNAIKYTTRGSIELSARNVEEGVEFSVKDTGVGISKDEISKIFDKFYRANDPQVQKVNSSGLGLYVCQKLAKLLDGHLSVDSTVNKGSTFKFWARNLG